jgi:hypothetical protein
LVHTGVYERWLAVERQVHAVRGINVACESDAVEILLRIRLVYTPGVTKQEIEMIIVLK